MKRIVSFRLEEGLEPFIKQKPNLTKYINGLIKDDVQTKNAEPIYQAITQKLLGDDELLAHLARKLNQAANKPVAMKVDGLEYVEGDFGV